MFSFCFLFSLARMSLEQRLCPGVGSRKCGVFMSPLFRDPHPSYGRCRGFMCSSDVICDICKDWLVAQWEVLPPAPPPIPPSASASTSLEVGRRSPSLPPSSLPSEGCGRAEKSEGVSRVGSRVVSSRPFFLGGGGVLASGVECDSAASSLLGGGVLLALTLSRLLPLPWSSEICDRTLARLGALLGAAPAVALPGPPFQVTGSPGKGDVKPACSLVGRVPGLESRALAPRPIRGLVHSRWGSSRSPSARVQSR